MVLAGGAPDGGRISGRRLYMSIDGLTLPLLVQIEW